MHSDPAIPDRYFRGLTVFYQPKPPVEPELPEPDYVPTLEELKKKRSMFRFTKRQIRARLVLEDPVCFYCGVRLTLNNSTLDHCIPKSRGGKHRLNNLVLACRPCNQDKKDKIYIKR